MMGGMSLLGLILIIALAGFILWAVNVYIPMADPVKRILNVVVVVILILWLLQVFGLLGDLRAVKVPQL
jgi:uncharacterized protein YhhL (DUF1145 family)